MSPVRVFVVAASPVVRAGLRSILADVEEIEVCGESADPGSAGSGVEALVVADEDLLPDVAASAEEVGASVVLIADDERAVSRLRSLGLLAWSVVTPDASSEELAAAVIAAARGLVAMSGEMAGRLLGEPVVEEAPGESLTARESEVLGLLAEGLSNKMISRRLGISEHTVKFHVSSIYAKLGAGNRAEAVSRGARRGIISL
ncbi:MAG: response regulator transcription factor [Actinomycetota bacterium]